MHCGVVVSTALQPVTMAGSLALHLVNGSGLSQGQGTDRWSTPGISSTKPGATRPSGRCAGPTGFSAPNARLSRSSRTSVMTPSRIANVASVTDVSGRSTTSLGPSSRVITSPCRPGSFPRIHGAEPVELAHRQGTRHGPRRRSSAGPATPSGIVDRGPAVVLKGEVECDEVDVVAGHKGNPEALKKERATRAPPSPEGKAWAGGRWPRRSHRSSG
jgi:hypothetical protein